MRRRRRMIIKQHKKLVLAGLYEEARLLLCFLRHKRLLLGLDNVSWFIGLFLDEIGCRRTTLRSGWAIYRI